MHAVLVLFRPLLNVDIQNFGMWGMYNLAKAYGNIENPGPLFTKRTDVLPQDLAKSRGREIRV